MFFAVDQSMSCDRCEILDLEFRIFLVGAYLPQ